MSSQFYRMLIVALLCLVWVAPTPSRASPTIHWSGPIEHDIQIGAWGEYFTPIDFDNNGVDDILFRTQPTSMHLSALDANSIVATALQFGNEYLPIPEDALIDSSIESPLLWESDEKTILSYMVNGFDELVGGGSWYDTDHEFLGVSFYSGDDLHYGWVRMSQQEVFTLTIHDWAYETQPGVGISVGVVPEPGTMFLFAIGLGALGWSRWRRKRKP